MDKGVGGGLSGEEQLQGPSPLRLELGEHELMLKRLKIDKNLMMAQWLDSSLCVGPGRRGGMESWECPPLGSLPGDSSLM